MTLFTNNNVSSGDIVRASDHNSQGAAIAAVVNGNIDNANINASAAIAGTKLADSSITTAKIADTAVTNAKLATGAGEAGGAWTSFTPTLTNVTLGNGTVTAHYTKVGRTVTVRVRLVRGSTTSFTGEVVIINPVAGSTAAGTSQICGTAYYEDQGVTGYLGFVRMDTINQARLLTGVASGTYTQVDGVTNTKPHTWGAGDYLTAQWTYEAA